MKSVRILLLWAILLNVHGKLVAQEVESSHPIGIMATVQDGQFGFLIPIWVDQQFSLAPSLSISTAAGVGSEYGIGIVPRYYFRREKVSPFVGLRAAALLFRPDIKPAIDQINTTDILVGGTFGADYFFDQQLAIGVELQGNFTFSDENSLRFNNPGKTNFNTASSIFISIYF
ncbi:MAG: hypothetical protein HRU41_35420 [Saprospiraceae bacterium]|nr:hypothetical protein [Saprospiraceae bacterium]